MKKKYQEPTMRLHLLRGQIVMINSSHEITTFQKQSVFIGDDDE